MKCNLFLFFSTVININKIPSPEGQVPKNCYSGKQVQTKAKKNANMLDSTINTWSTNATAITDMIQNKNRNGGMSLDDITNGKFCGLLIASELSSFAPDRAKLKYKQLMRFLSELD